MEQVRVRMSEELRERLKAEAKRSVRSLNGEIVFRLRQSVEAQRQRSANPVEPGRMNATQDPRPDRGDVLHDMAEAQEGEGMTAVARIDCRAEVAGSNRLPVLAATINEHLEAAETATRRGLEHAIAAGLLLIEAKELVAHGEWIPWLKANCRLSPRQAQIYMRLARNRHKLTALKNAPDSHLTIAAAVALVGKPKPERPHGLPGQLDLLGGPEVPPLTPPTGLERADLRAAFQERCAQAESFATYAGPVDDEVADAAERVVAAWERLARDLRGKVQDAKAFDRAPRPPRIEPANK